MTETMQRWALDAVGREHLALARIPIPEPRPGEVLVKVAAVSLNYRDKLVIDGAMPLPLAFPFTPASDLAGTVVALGEGAGRFAVGQRVISTFEAGWIDGAPEGTARNPPYRTLGGVHPGVLSEFVAFPEAWFAPAPASLDDAEASTLPVAGLTAWSALVEYGRLRAGQTVLLQGTGGVSLFALQIAKAHGAEVIVTSSGLDKLARVKALGADHGILRRDDAWVAAVHERTADRGADHILEMAGGANLGRSVEAVAVQGRISVIGVFDGFTFSGPMGPLLRKQPVIQGISVGHRRALEDFARAVDRVGLKPVIDRRFAFADLPAALDHLDRGPFGKIVVTLDG